jgi:Mrp family chromosome partitioning ATPase
MQRSYVSTFMRHKTLCVLPAALAAALGIGVGLTRPSDYIATAAIFADAPLLDPSTIGTTGGAAPPAAGQQALMSNFLATRSFRLSVARASGLPGFEADKSPLLLEKALAVLAAGITTSTPGPNVLVVQVTQPRSVDATNVAKAVVSEFLELEHTTIGRRAAAQRADAKTKVDAAAAAVDAAQRKLASYVSGHPTVPGTVDAEATVLRGAVSLAQTQYTEVVRAQQESAVAAPGVNESNLFVIDQPNDAYPKGRLKALAMGGMGGLLAGLSLALGALMLLMSRDTAIRDEADVRVQLGLSVVGSIPVLAQPRQMRRIRRAAPLPAPRVSVAAGAAPSAAPRGTGPANGCLPPAPVEWVPEGVLGPCRSVLRRLNHDGPGSIAVVGTGQGDGSTTVALGVALVQRNDYEQRTVLIELDFWNPTMARRLGMPGPFGIAEVLRGEMSLEEAIQWPDGYLGVLAAGVVDDPATLLSAFHRSPVLSELNARGYCVVADLPPLPPAGRGDRVADMFWNVLLVLRSGVTSLTVAREAVACLPATPAAMLNHAAPKAAGWIRSGSAA